MFPGKTWSLSWPDTETVLATPLVLSDSFAASHSVFWSGLPSFSSAPWCPWGGLCRFWKKKIRKQKARWYHYTVLRALVPTGHQPKLRSGNECALSRTIKAFLERSSLPPFPPQRQKLLQQFFMSSVVWVTFSQVDWWSRTTAKSVV